MFFSCFRSYILTYKLSTGHPGICAFLSPHWHATVFQIIDLSKLQNLPSFPRRSIMTIVICQLYSVQLRELYSLFSLFLFLCSFRQGERNLKSLIQQVWNVQYLFFPCQFIDWFLRGVVMMVGAQTEIRNWNLAAKFFSYKEIKAATNKFKEVIGRGSFGTVYLGKLPDGKLVAVKVRFDKSQLGADSFLNEVHHLTLFTLQFHFCYFSFMALICRFLYCRKFVIKILYHWKVFVTSQSNKY